MVERVAPVLAVDGLVLSTGVLWKVVVSESKGALLGEGEFEAGRLP